MFLLTICFGNFHGRVALWECIMHHSHLLKDYLCTAKTLHKQGNMPLIKISFIFLLIKRHSLVIECVCPSFWILCFYYRCFFSFFSVCLVLSLLEGSASELYSMLCIIRQTILFKNITERQFLGFVVLEM